MVAIMMQPDFLFLLLCLVWVYLGGWAGIPDSAGKRTFSSNGLMNKLSVITFNLKGINNPIKQKEILNYLKSHKCDIAFLQETYLTEIEHEKLRLGC